MISHNNMDMAERTYTGFIGLVKWGTIASVAVAALVIVLIT